ncbi:MAG TPA: ribonuclease HII [candidate division Zixibacteria bacterium]|nr:ribonuclease HII [candidate division Zixibacteria bacterium]
MSSKIIVGADEAGRGIIIGPMVIGACAIDENISILLKRESIKDSKKYTSYRKLKTHSEFIKKKSLTWSVIILTAEVLNNFNKNGMTMDEAEAYAFFRAIEDISKKTKNISEYQVDNFQAVKKLQSLLSENNLTKDIKLTVLPRADQKYIAVSAGSILARTRSLEEMEKIKAKYGLIGSGSTNDKTTINWLKNYYQKNQTWPMSIVRTYWKTIQKIEKEYKK